MISSDLTRQLLSRHGTCKAQSSCDWGGPFELPVTLSRFYEEVGPVDLYLEGYGNPLFLPRLSSLWQYQAGYRWEGSTEAPVEDWKPDWLVVADERADPYIFCLNNDEILFAYHGEGSWSPSFQFTSINAMAASFATLASIIEEASMDFTDEESYVLPKWRTRAIEDLTSLLGDRDYAESIVDSSGWQSAT